MKRVLIMLCLLALPLAAQDAQKKEEPKLPEPRIQKLFVLKYVDPQQLSRALGSFGASMNYSPELRAMTVSATPGTMAAVEEAIKQLDIPTAAPQNIELLVYFLIGSDGAAPSSPPLPKDLETVVAQLRNTFAYKNFRLMDILTLRTRTGRGAETAGSGGTVEIGGNRQPIITRFSISSASVSAGSQIRIDGLRAMSKVPVATGPTAGSGVNPIVNTQFSYQDLGINTDIDIKEGQKVVVGKNSLSNNEAMFLVLTARMAQ